MEETIRCSVVHILESFLELGLTVETKVKPNAMGANIVGTYDGLTLEPVSET